MASPFPGSARRFLKATASPAVETDAPLFRLLESAMNGSRIISKLTPGRFRQEELDSLTMPVLVILGDNDPAHAEPGATIKARLNSQLVNGSCELLTEAGHLWSDAQFDETGRLIAGFLAE